VHLQGLRFRPARREFVARKPVSDSRRFSGALFGAPLRLLTGDTSTVSKGAGHPPRVGRLSSDGLSPADILTSGRPSGTPTLGAARRAAIVSGGPCRSVAEPRQHFHGKGIRVDAAGPIRRWIQRFSDSGEFAAISLLPRTSGSSRLRSISAVFRHRVQYERSMECAGR